MSGDDQSTRTEVDEKHAALEQLEAPFRSEEAMFKVFVAVALVAAPVIAIGLIFGPVAGLVALLFEVGVGLGVWLSRRRSRSAAGTRRAD